MPTLIRLSPSGPASSEGTPQGSDGIENRSSVPGATFTDALDAIDAELDELDAVTVTDDFLGGPSAFTGLSSVGLYGDLGWTFTSSSAAGELSRPTDQEYMGAYGVMAPASARSALTFAPNSTQAAITLAVAQYNYLEFLVCPNIDDAASGGSFRAGIGVDASLTNFGTNAIFIEVARAVSDTWRIVGRITSVNVAIQSVIPFAPHALTRVRLTRALATGSWTGSINGVDFGTLTSAQVPASRMIAGVQVESAAGGPQRMAIDRFSLSMRAPLF